MLVVALLVVGAVLIWAGYRTVTVGRFAEDPLRRWFGGGMVNAGILFLVLAVMAYPVKWWALPRILDLLSEFGV